MSQSRLSQEALGDLYDTAVALNLDRAALLAGVNLAFVAQIETTRAPGTQIYRDLHEMSLVDRLVDGSDPLRQWLENAKTLTAHRLESAVFARHLATLASSGTLPESPVPAPALRPVEDGVADENSTALFESIFAASRAAKPFDSSGILPYRHFVSRPAGPYPVIPVTQLFDRVWGSRLFQRRGIEMFPPFPIAPKGIRGEGSITFKEDTRGSILSVGTDGSVQYVEFADEAFRRIHPYWGQGIGLFHCIDRLVGLVLMLHPLYGFSAPRAVSLALKVGNVTDRRLAFDFNDWRPVSEGNYLLRQKEVFVGGTLQIPSTRERILKFATECGRYLSFLAGFDASAEPISKEILETIVNNAAFDFGTLA